MSDLRVTDVQEALRHFQNLGHDVVTDPRAVHIDGQQYGMAVGHMLRYLSNAYDRNGTYLHSHLMQSERPLLSHVYTGSYKQSPSFEKTIRSVVPLAPNITTYSDAPAFHTYALNYHNLADKAVGSWSEESQGKPGSPLWEPSGGYSSVHKDIHEALEAHRTSDVSHEGTLQHEGKSLGLMKDSDMSRFNHREALKSVFKGGDPFKGLIYVSHAPTESYYTYNPDTEQLLKVN